MVIVLGFVAGVVAVLLGAVATSVLYERVAQRSITNFAVGTTKTPLELLSEEADPPEPVFSEAEFKKMFLNDDEEEVQALLDSGKITKEQVPDVLDALGISQEIHFS